MVLVMTMEYLYCKATGQEMEERKRWFQFWKDDIKKDDDDTEKTSMTELAYVYQSSPVYDQIPTELHKGWYIKSLESSSIGKVEPKDADECVDCINRARQTKDTTLKMILIKVLVR